MLYMVHNTKSNYLNADAAGDDKMKRDIVLSEVAKMIVANPGKVLEHLKASGVKVNGSPDGQKLASIVAQTMRGSKQFAQLMAKDIAAGAGNLNCNGCQYSAAACPPGYTQNYFGQCFKNKKAGGHAADGEKVDAGEVLGAASVLMNAFGSVFGGKDKNKETADKTNATAEKELKAKTETVGRPAKKPVNVMKIVAISIGVAIVIGGSIWIFKAVKK